MMLRLLTTLALLAGLAGTSVAARPDDGLRRQKLSNGLTLILAPDPRAGGVDVSVWYRAGTRWERSGKTGVTHMVEQLMFRSASHEGPGDYIARVRQAGGTVGAEGSPDHASFFQTVPPEALDMVFAMEADRMSELRLTPERFAEVRTLVRQNRARAGNTPIVRGMQHLLAGAFEGHPYAWPVIGREEDLSAITLDDCLAWHRERYGPGNAIVTVTGRFKTADVIASARRTFGMVARRDLPRETPLPAAMPAGASRTVATYAFTGASVLLGWRVPAASSENPAALELLARYLAGEPTAPLDVALRGPERPTVYTQCGVESRREAGVFFALAALQPGADSAAVAAVESAMLAEIEKVVKEGPDETRLGRVRKGLELSRLLALQRPHGRADAIGRAELIAGDAKRGLQTSWPDAAGVRAAAARFLAAPPPVTVWMMPGGPVDGEVK